MQMRGILRIDVFALAVILTLLAASSCYLRNPGYCPGFPHNECPADGPDYCSRFPPNACPVEDEVAFVQGGASGKTCTRAEPCGTLSEVVALPAAMRRPYISVSGEVMEDNPVTIAFNVEIVGNSDVHRGGARTSECAPATDDKQIAKLLPKNPGDLIRITDRSTKIAVIIRDLEFANVIRSDIIKDSVAISVDAGTSTVSLANVAVNNNAYVGISLITGLLTISNSIISCNGTVAGSGIFVDTGDLTITQSEIANNQGNGIETSIGSTGNDALAITIDRSEIIGNGGRGVAAGEPGQPTGNGTLTLKLTRSTIKDNTGGGLGFFEDGMNVAFSVIGNIIAGNGTAASDVGGIRIEALWSAMNRLEFNTITNNHATQAPGKMTGSGIHCNPEQFVTRNNIIVNNDPELDNEIGGRCLYAYSMLSDAGRDQPGGNNIIETDAVFVDPDNGNYHLQLMSPALGNADRNFVADPLSQIDLDGDQRQDMPDIGADEVP